MKRQALCSSVRLRVWLGLFLKDLIFEEKAVAASTSNQSFLCDDLEQLLHKYFLLARLR